MLYILTFMFGGIFGMVVMSLMVCSGNASREEEKREKYNQDNIFKNKNTKAQIINQEIPQNSTNTALIEYKETFFTRFKNFIFKILHINK